MNREAMPYLQVINEMVEQAKAEADMQLLTAAAHDVNILSGLEACWRSETIDHPLDQDKGPS